MTRYGIIGFGRIGQRLAARMRGPDAPRLAAVLVRPEQADTARLTTAGAAIVTDLQAFIACGLDVAVECASAATLTACGSLLLQAGVDLVPLSLAALTDPLVEAQLRDAAATGPGRIELAAGAMASLDFLATAREDTLDTVTFRAAYPPARWIGTPAADRIDLARVTERTVFFRGSVREAARLFPRHLNVSVAVALAGLGLDATMTELAADPALRQADFSVDAIAGAGSIRLYVGPRDVAAGADPVDHTTFSVMRVLRRRGARIAI
jgi:aspartate dehydrogenase